MTQGENLEEQVSTHTQGRSEGRDRRNAGTHRLQNGPHLRSDQRFLPGRSFGEGQEDPAYDVWPRSSGAGADRARERITARRASSAAESGEVGVTLYL